MTAEEHRGIDQVFGNVRPPAPGNLLWGGGFALALAIHLAAAVPYLAEPVEAVMVAMDTQKAINVSLAPMVAPPKQETPPEPKPEEPSVQKLEERMENSPPPAPPAKPREAPDMPDIIPQAIPEIWGGSSTGGTLTLEEFLASEQWLSKVRMEILKNLDYPFEVRRRNLTGKARVVVTAHRDGYIDSWHFKQETAHPALNRLVESALKRTRRISKIPANIEYDRLSFTLPIRFELVYEGKVVVPAEGPAAPTREAEDTGLAVDHLRVCAQNADALLAKRSAIEDKRAALEALSADYQRQATRYHRDRREIPRRVERMLDQYNEGVAEYETMITTFNMEVAAYSDQCGGGGTTWNKYRRACTAYVAVGNQYCESFGPFWERLQAGA